jgi:hypothetical protein
LSEETVCNFLTKNNTAPAGSITDGITNANINSSKDLFIIENDSVDDDCCAGLAKFWILNPKMNDDVLSGKTL